MTTHDDLIRRLRQYKGRQWETTACYNGLRADAADALADSQIALREAEARIAKLQKLDVEYGRVEVAIIMADQDFDGDSDHANCGDRLVASVNRLRDRAAEAEAEVSRLRALLAGAVSREAAMKACNPHPDDDQLDRQCKWECQAKIDALPTLAQPEGGDHAPADP